MKSFEEVFCSRPLLYVLAVPWAGEFTPIKTIKTLALSLELGCIVWFSIYLLLGLLELLYCARSFTCIQICSYLESKGNLWLPVILLREGFFSSMHWHVAIFFGGKCIGWVASSLAVEIASQAFQGYLREFNLEGVIYWTSLSRTSALLIVWLQRGKLPIPWAAWCPAPSFSHFGTVGCTELVRTFLAKTLGKPFLFSPLPMLAVLSKHTWVA